VSATTRTEPTSPIDLRIEVPADLDAVTTIGEETPSDINVEWIWAAVRDWYRVGVNPAMQLCLRVDGEIILNRSIGHSVGNAPKPSPSLDHRESAVRGPEIEKVLATPDTPYCVYSAAKGLATVVMHRLIERGDLALDAHVCDYLPGYTSHGKDRTTIAHVLGHRAGVPLMMPGRGGDEPSGSASDLDHISDSAFAVAQLCAQKPQYRPGLISVYHALTFGFLVREIVQAATGRSIRDILADEVLTPLGFRWTNFGVLPDEVPLVARSHHTAREVPEPFLTMFRKAIGGGLGKVIAMTNDPRFLTAVVPSSSGVSTAQELSKFYEILRRGGGLDGVQVLTPQTLERALVPTTRTRPDISVGLRPMRWGSGFMLGGKRSGPFGRNTAGSFGHMGLIDVAGWADPRRGVAGGLITSGKPGPHANANGYNILMNRIAAVIPQR